MLRVGISFHLKDEPGEGGTEEGAGQKEKRKPVHRQPPHLRGALSAGLGAGGVCQAPAEGCPEAGWTGAGSLLLLKPETKAPKRRVEKGLRHPGVLSL